MRVLRYWRLGLGAAVALSVGLAFADPVPAVTYPECNRKPTPADVEGAKGAHKAANQFYDRGDYDKAIRYWNDAYSFDCTAYGVLINVANAYEKKGDKPAAIATLETYIKRSGPDPTIEEKVKNLKQSLQISPLPPTTSVIPTATVSSSALPTSSASAIPTTPPTVVQRPYGLAPWVVVGVGGAAVLGGLILLPLGLSDIRAAESHCPNRECPQSEVEFFRSGNDGRVRAGIGIAGLSIGGVAMASGLVWQLMFNRPREVATAPLSLKSIGPGGVQLTPAVGRGQVGLTVSGGF
jgi:tetratricopeptide (TPR) repeat protein